MFEIVVIEYGLGGMEVCVCFPDEFSWMISISFPLVIVSRPLFERAILDILYFLKASVRQLFVPFALKVFELFGVQSITLPPHIGSVDNRSGEN